MTELIEIIDDIEIIDTNNQVIESLDDGTIVEVITESNHEEVHDTDSMGIIISKEALEYIDLKSVPNIVQDAINNANVELESKVLASALLQELREDIDTLDSGVYKKVYVDDKISLINDILLSKVDENQVASISSSQVTIALADYATANRVNQIESKTDGNTATITTIETTLTNETEARVSKTEELTVSMADIAGELNAIQKQVDGKVEHHEGLVSPVNEVDFTPDVNIQPYKTWLENEVLENAFTYENDFSDVSDWSNGLAITYQKYHTSLKLTLPSGGSGKNYSKKLFSNLVIGETYTIETKCFNVTGGAFVANEAYISILNNSILTETLIDINTPYTSTFIANSTEVEIGIGSFLDPISEMISYWDYFNLTNQSAVRGTEERDKHTGDTYEQYEVIDGKREYVASWKFVQTSLTYPNVDSSGYCWTAITNSTALAAYKKAVQLEQLFAQQQVKITEINNILLDVDGWRAEASKIITDPDGNITGWSASDGSNQHSTFNIMADVFNVVASTGENYTPFTINAVTKELEINGKITFNSVKNVPNYQTDTQVNSTVNSAKSELENKIPTILNLIDDFENGIGLWTPKNAQQTISLSNDSFQGSNSALISSTDILTNANSGSTTGGVYFTLEEEFENMVSGQTIEIILRAKKPTTNASDEFEVSYSTNEVGNSGWQRFTPTTSWQEFSFSYYAPPMVNGNLDYLGIHGDTSGTGKGVLIDSVFIKVKNFDAYSEMRNRLKDVENINTSLAQNELDKALLDGKIDNEETARINAINLEAQTRANDILERIQAESALDGKINTTEQELIDHANILADAQADYTDSVKQALEGGISQAEQTAISQAQTKVDTAKANLQNLIGLATYGVVPTYGGADYSTISYDENEKAVKLHSPTDSSIAMAFPAFKVNKTVGEKFTVKLSHKASANYSSGFYIIICEYDSELPSGKTHVCNSAVNPVVQEDTRVRWVKSNVAITNQWENFTYDYTPNANAKYVSVVVMNWTGLGTAGSLYIKDYQVAPKLGALAVKDNIDIDMLPTDAKNSSINFPDEMQNVIDNELVVISDGAILFNEAFAAKINALGIVAQDVLVETLVGKRIIGSIIESAVIKNSWIDHSSTKDLSDWKQATDIENSSSTYYSYRNNFAKNEDGSFVKTDSDLYYRLPASKYIYNNGSAEYILNNTRNINETILYYGIRLPAYNTYKQDLPNRPIKKAPKGKFIINSEEAQSTPLVMLETKSTNNGSLTVTSYYIEIIIKDTRYRFTFTLHRDQRWIKCTIKNITNNIDLHTLQEGFNGKPVGDLNTYSLATLLGQDFGDFGIDLVAVYGGSPSTNTHYGVWQFRVKNNLGVGKASLGDIVASNYGTLSYFRIYSIFFPNDSTDRYWITIPKIDIEIDEA